MAFSKWPYQYPKTESEGFRNAATFESWTQRYYAAIYRNTNQTLGGGGWSHIDFNTVYSADDPLLFNTSIGGFGQYLAKADGLYVAHGRCQLQQNTVNNPQRFIIAFWKNDVEDINTIYGNEHEIRGGVSGDLWMLVVSGAIPMRKGETLALRVFNGDGAGNSVTASASNRTVSMEVYRHGPHPGDLFR